MKKGHPTKQQSQQIRDDLWSCFARGLGAPFTLQKTGYNKKTVYDHFKEWEKQIHDNDERNFEDKIRQEKKRVDVAYDYLLVELDEKLNEIDNEIKFYKNKKEPVPRYLYDYHLRYVKEIANIIEKRTSVRMMIPLDEQIKEIVKKELEKQNVHN